MVDESFRGLFDLTMTYERGADVWMPYFQYERLWDDHLSRPIPDKTEAAPLVMFQSSSMDQSGRIPHARKLMQHMKVDSYGKVLNNRKLTGGIQKESGVHPKWR